MKTKYEYIMPLPKQIKPTHAMIITGKKSDKKYKNIWYEIVETNHSNDFYLKLSPTYYTWRSGKDLMFGYKTKFIK